MKKYIVDDWSEWLKTFIKSDECSGEAGLVTAEYAVGIVTAVAFAGLLLAIIKSDSVRQILFNLIQNALTVAA